MTLCSDPGWKELHPVERQTLSTVNNNHFLEYKMNLNLYPSANCDEATLAELIDQIPGQADHIGAHGVCGYYAIDGHMVPYSFIDRLADHLSDFVLDYDMVHSARDTVSDEFWDDLTQAERDVLAPCLLLLVERGQFPVIFAAPKTN